MAFVAEARGPDFFGQTIERRCILARMIAILLPLMTAAALAAQAATGTISGLVKDETGAILPGATIIITNTDTAQGRTLVADGSGRYAAPDLPPGPYEVKVTSQGFTSVVRSGIRLTVGRDAAVDGILTPGEMSAQTSDADAP